VGNVANDGEIHLSEMIGRAAWVDGGDDTGPTRRAA
jgi:hypothetical protein